MRKCNFLFQLKSNRSLEESESEVDNDLYAFDASLRLDNVDCDEIDADVLKKIYGCDVETLPVIENYAGIEVSGVKDFLDSTLAPDMDTNNEISKVGLVKADSLHVRVIANPNTYDDHHLKNIIETGEIDVSVGYSGTPCPTPFTYRQPTNYCRYLQRRRTRQRHRP